MTYHCELYRNNRIMIIKKQKQQGSCLESCKIKRPAKLRVDHTHVNTQIMCTSLACGYKHPCKCRVLPGRRMSVDIPASLPNLLLNSHQSVCCEAIIFHLHWTQIYHTFWTFNDPLMKQLLQSSSIGQHKPWHWQSSLFTMIKHHAWLNKPSHNK